MKREILILTGPVHSGKTTLLLNWTMQQPLTCGILSPEIEGIRYFFDIEHRNLFLMTASPEETPVLEVGRYRFSEAGFSRASLLLKQAYMNPSFEMIVIDEIGPLELKQQKGFYETLLFLLDKPASACRILLVVRDNCLEDIRQLLEEKNCRATLFTTESFRKNLSAETGQ